jgi:copper(I)-binding protein
MSLVVRLAFAFVLAGSTAVLAHSFTKGDILVDHPWTRATPGEASVGVGYVKITNNGSAADRFTGGTLDGAEALEIHEMKMDGDVMQMRHLDKGLEIAPGATIELAPGGNHLMFMGLKKPIVAGENRKGTLSFEKAGAIDVEFTVEKAGATESGEH